MKKLLAGIVLGLFVGVVPTLLLLRPPAKVPENSENPPASPPQIAGLHLTKEQQRMAGIEVSLPKAIDLVPESRAFGRVLDPAPLAALLAEIATARSDLNLAAKEYDRLKSLGENASARALESAEAAVQRNTIAVDSARARLLSGWGNALATRADLESLTRSLVLREKSVARVAIPPGETLATPPTAMRVTSAAGNGNSQAAEVVGPAPDVDPQSPGDAYLVLVPGQALPPGAPLAAWCAKGGESGRGFLLPRDALVQYESEMFVFVQTDEESFQRKRVGTSLAQRDGIVVTNGIVAEDRVVVTGAQQLLSEEFKSASSPE